MLFEKRNKNTRVHSNWKTSVTLSKQFEMYKLVFISAYLTLIILLIRIRLGMYVIKYHKP